MDGSHDEPQDISSRSSELGLAEKNAELEIPPEEGRQGWIVVIGSILTMFCSIGFLNASVKR